MRITTRCARQSKESFAFLGIGTLARLVYGGNASSQHLPVVTS